MKGMHRSLLRGDEAEMAAVAEGRRLAVDRRLHPEFRILAAEGHSPGVAHDLAATKSGQYLGVKRAGGLEVVGADGHVGQDAGVGFAHGALLEEHTSEL